MRIKYIIAGSACTFILLLIVGAIFAIKAHVDGEDAAFAPASTSTQTPIAQAPNPLAADSPASNPLAANPATSIATPQSNTGSGNDIDPATTGYTVLASANAGRTIFAQKTDATTAQAAIVATLRDLTRILDSKPAVQGAFADAQQQRRGGATFTGTLNGHFVKGTIFCGVGDKGAAVTIIYDRADAPASDWATLTAALPLDLKMREQSIGDGAGTISVPADWKISNSSNIGSVVIQGPAKQIVSLGIGMEVVTPDSMGAATQRQLANMGQLTPATRMLVAPLTGPVDALKNLMPQLSDMSQSRGGPSISLDKVIQSDAVTAQLPGGQAARSTIHPPIP